MRALIGATVVLALAGCGTKQCKDGSLLLTLSLDGSSSAATQLAVNVTIGTQVLNATVAHAAGNSGGTLEVDFPSGYPAGTTATVTVTANGGDGTLGSGMTTVALSGTCTTAPIAVTGSAAVADDLSMPTSSTDLSVPDDLTMAPADLTSFPDLATCTLSASSTIAYVDPVNGIDNAFRGNQAGCPVKTITYALAHVGTATKIDLAFGTYNAASGETFPIGLVGTQSIDGDPTGSGNKATIDGAGANSDGATSTVTFKGSSNSLANTILTVSAQTAQNTCFKVMTAGTGTTGHVISNCEIHHCGTGTMQGTAISDNNGGKNLNIVGCNLHDVYNGVFFYADTGAIQKTTLTNIPNAGIDCFATTNTNVTGCGDTFTAACACANCSSFSVACP